MRRIIHYNYQEFEGYNKRWSGAMIGAAAIAAAIGGGVALYEGGQNREAAQKAQDQYNAQPDFLQLPDYAESTSARENWAKTLTDWGQSGSYGANLSNYDAIYENAKKRVNQYYWGGISGQPGLIDKIQARGAARGVQDSPAIDVLTQRAGAEEAGKLGDISTTVDTTKATAVEQARNNWLNSLMQLSSLKPSFVSGKTGQFSSQSGVEGMTNLFGTAATGVQSYYQNQQNQQFQEQLTDKYLLSTGYAPTTQSSLTSLGGYSGYGDYGGGFADTENMNYWMNQ